MNKKISRQFQQILLLAVTLFIFLLSIYGRKIQELLTSVVGSIWIAGAVFSVLLLILIYLFCQRKNNATPVWAICLPLFILISMAVAVYNKYLLPIEAVHLVVFSVFGWLAAAVLGPAKALVAVIIISTGDELLQHYLPDRVGDIRDVVINLMSGLAGVILRRKC